MWSRTDDVRARLDPQAEASDGAPYYCVYSGPIQGVWKRPANVVLIQEVAECSFSKAYSWAEVRYVLAANQSFEDILNGRGGWDALHAVLIYLFGSDRAVIIGPEVRSALHELQDTSPSLLRVLFYASRPGTAFLDEPNAAAALVSASLEAATHHRGVIDPEIERRMMIFDTVRVTRNQVDLEIRVLGRPSNLVINHSPGQNSRSDRWVDIDDLEERTQEE